MYDPRPNNLRQNSSLSLENLRCDLLNSCSTQSCALLTILVPSVKSIEHDHPYSLPCGDQPCSDTISKAANNNEPSDVMIMRSDLSPEMHTEMQTVVEKLYLTSEQRHSLEAHTRDLSFLISGKHTNLWHQERRYRITGSKCG